MAQSRLCLYPLALWWMELIMWHKNFLKFTFSELDYPKTGGFCGNLSGLDVGSRPLQHSTCFQNIFFIRFIFNPEHIWKSNLESLTDLFFQLVWQDGYKRSAQERFSRIFSSILSWLDNWTQQSVIRRMFFFFKHGNIPEICIQQPWVLDWPILLACLPGWFHVVCQIYYLQYYMGGGLPIPLKCIT